MDHALHDRISLELARRVAAELPARPDWIELARSNLARWKQLNADSPRLLGCYAEWEQLLGESPETICRVMVSQTEEGQRLRQNSPFAGALPPTIVWTIKNRLRHESAAA